MVQSITEYLLDILSLPTTHVERQIFKNGMFSHFAYLFLWVAYQGKGLLFGAILMLYLKKKKLHNAKKKNQVYFTKNLQLFSRDLISFINASQQVRN